MRVKPFVTACLTYNNFEFALHLVDNSWVVQNLSTNFILDKEIKLPKKISHDF
jgi:hypothetical protein